MLCSRKFGVLLAAGLLTLLLDPPRVARADSVAQVQTAKRISRQTVILIDPQGRPGTTMGSTDTTIQPGDILTFIIQFTPVPNGANRGLGGYITDYIPLNTEVVGARIIDRNGNTVPPHRGGLAADGVGPRGPQTFTPNTLPQGSLSQLYADTGIFFSTDPRTARIPDGSLPGEAFISLFNGVAVNPDPTGADNLLQILGSTGPVYAHNYWDLAQVLAFGVKGGAIGSRGKGVTPDRYGSPVAGPDTWYPYEATWDWWDAASQSVRPPTLGSLSAVDIGGAPVVGPWRRIRTLGQEIGTRGAAPDANGNMPDPGIATRVGVPAVDPSTGELLGWPLSPDNPLPSYDPVTYDPNDPNTWYTTAVRFAVGELVVGEEYFAEISLRVKDTPLDPISGLDINCAEVTGGDASAERSDGTKGGKDNPWRYFVPAPSCVVLNNFFELSVDKLLALPGDPLVYTIEGKNLSTHAQTGATARLCYDRNELTFVSADSGGTHDPTGTGCPDPTTQSAVLWNTGDLMPGDAYLYTAQFTVTGGGGNDMTVSRAIYTSNELPAPGFQVVAATTIVGSTRMELSGTAAPTSVSVAGAPAAVHYEVTVANTGTADADVDPGACGGAGCRVLIDLPSGFSYTPGTATIAFVDPAGTVTGPTGVADPAATGQQLEWTAGLAGQRLAPGASMRLAFDASVAQGTAAGAYTLTVETWVRDTGIGNDVSDTRTGLAEVLVDIARTPPPTLSGPLVSGTTTVSGTAAPNSEVVVYVNGVEVARVTADASGRWSATVPTLFAGQVVEATAQAPGQLPSEPSPAVTVAEAGTVAACNDGVDNDGDGLTDYPDDPGCTDPRDPDETDPPECADLVDNDGDGLTDYPNDPKCASFNDDSESGAPECSDGIDNDGDGLTDYPDDPGCADANGRREFTPPACSDGIDNDGDGLTDYPFDDGCASSLDESESSTITPPTDGGMGDGGSAANDGGSTDAGNADGGMAPDGGMAADGGGGRPDPGGVPEPKGAAAGGCACSASGTGRGGVRMELLLLALLLPLRRRRCGSAARPEEA